MAGDYVRAVFGTLQTGEQDFASAYSQLTSTCSTLDSQLRASLADWDGQAQQAYYTAQTTWDNAIADMGMVIQQLSQVVGTAGQNYTSAESTNAAMFQ
jgi:6 kDa early secretory antigenic target